jgi:hypothetical protein
MPDQPVREIEVEILPPGAIPKARPGSPPPPRQGSAQAESEARRGESAQPRAGVSFEDPFFALVARLMDSAFVIPGTNFRFGLDPLIGLIPGIGDGATALTSLMLVLRAAGHGIPKIVMAHMALNIILNTCLGAVPIFGDAFSFWFKSNDRNYELLCKHAAPGSSTRAEWTFVIALLAGVVLVLVLTVIGYATMIGTLIHLFSGK